MPERPTYIATCPAGIRNWLRVLRCGSANCQKDCQVLAVSMRQWSPRHRLSATRGHRLRLGTLFFCTQVGVVKQREGLRTPTSGKTAPIALRYRQCCSMYFWKSFNEVMIFDFLGSHRDIGGIFSWCSNSGMHPCHWGLPWCSNKNAFAPPEFPNS